MIRDQRSCTVVRSQFEKSALALTQNNGAWRLEGRPPLREPELKSGSERLNGMFPCVQIKIRSKKAPSVHGSTGMGCSVGIEATPSVSRDRNDRPVHKHPTCPHPLVTSKI